MANWIAIFLIAALTLLSSSCLSIEVTYDSRAMIIDGQRKIIISGAIHYPRSTPEMWPDLIKKAKEGGLDAIETYIFWNAHEPRYREYDFSGNLDFVKFFKLIEEAGLYGIIRIGPYVCAEWNYGGHPVWLHNMPGVVMRTDNPTYMREMETFTTKIVNMAKEAKLFASQGGPIILAQIENEYGNWHVMSEYGQGGKNYIDWAAKMAINQQIGIPWIMCQQDNTAPLPMINTCNGYYCDGNSHPNKSYMPQMWTENWAGWYKNWGERDPHRTAEDLAYAVVRWYQKGGILQNYYMYHGGTNFGRSSGGPEVVTSYDYDAPLDEYGNIRQPKYGHLKQLHDILHMGEKILTNSTMTWKDLGNQCGLSTFTHPSGERFCFLSNANASQDFHINLEDNQTFFVPAWSVSILGGCTKELYNTAKVNVQTSVMVKKPAPEEDDAQASDTTSWSWAPESLEPMLQGEGDFKARQLMEQKDATFDESDYLWYMTSVDINGTSWSNATLNATAVGYGQGVYAYVNGELVGHQYARNKFSLLAPVSLKSGKNIITLLSLTVGLNNYGARYDLIDQGIIGGVSLIDCNNNTMNLTNSLWSYKVGLNDENKKLFDPNSLHNTNIWKSTGFPTGKPMHWYKRTFKTPSGAQPVVVDLLGMGKGMAWVNGNSLGRYWPASLAPTNGCNDTCDYRGTYRANKCNTNCGKPTQRYYHIPRSFLTNDTNTLILFEEMGGNPVNVSFPIVTTGAICGYAQEGNTLELSCQPGQVISEIQFASYGTVTGQCGNFKAGECDSSQSVYIVERVRIRIYVFLDNASHPMVVLDHHGPTVPRCFFK